MDMINEGTHIARSEASRTAVAPHAGEYLTYRLGAEEYGVDIQKVQEIRSCETPTRIPGAPAYVKGVVNLRGVIVPIVDLRLKLGCERADYNPFTVVIVLAVHKRVVGVVVDAVSDVLDLQAEAIKPPPEMAAGQGAEFVTGIAAVGERMLMLVDMDCLLGATLGTLPEADTEAA
jgi:purine-binding chemotaxis protein CheW